MAARQRSTVLGVERHMDSSTPVFSLVVLAVTLAAGCGDQGHQDVSRQKQRSETCSVTTFQHPFHLQLCLYVDRTSVRARNASDESRELSFKLVHDAGRQSTDHSTTIPAMHSIDFAVPSDGKKDAHLIMQGRTILTVRAD